MPSSTGNRDLDLALMTTLQTAVWELVQTCGATRAKIDAFRCEMLVNGIAGLTPPPPDRDAPRGKSLD